MLYFNPLAKRCPMKTVLLDRHRGRPIQLRSVIIYSVCSNIKTGFIAVLSNLNSDEYASGLISKAAFRCSLKESKVEPGYNDIGLSNTSSITLDILWYQVNTSVRKTLLCNDIKSVTCKTLHLK